MHVHACMQHPNPQGTMRPTPGAAPAARIECFPTPYQPPGPFFPLSLSRFLGLATWLSALLAQAPPSFEM